MAEHFRSLSIQTVRIAEEIERTRDICARSLELLHLPIPDTFLGNKLGPPREKEK